MFVRHFILLLLVSMALLPIFGSSFVPLFVPLFLWFSGHSRAPGDTERHKKSASLLDVYDFLRKFESGRIVCEASALPLSQAGNVFMSAMYRNLLLFQRLTLLVGCFRVKESPTLLANLLKLRTEQTK